MKLIELLEEKDDFFVKAENGLLVYNNVDLSYSKLKEFPNYPMVFFGDVYLNHTQIKELPDCPMTFFGNVDLGYTQIKELPDRIVCCYLDINGTSITKIPKDLIAYRICTPVKSKFLIYIQKDGKIGINGLEKSIDEWLEIFKERKLCDYFRINLPPEQYDIVEQDFKTAVKLLESWNS